MRQKAHILKGNKRSAWPQQVVWFDTETKPEPTSEGKVRHYLRLGWAIYQSQRCRQAIAKRPDYLYFTDRRTFGQWIESKAKNRRKLVLLASNVWFDLRVTDLDRYLLSRGWKPTRQYAKGLTQIFGFKKDRKHILCLNIQNFLPFGVKMLGEMLGLPKGEVDFTNVSDKVLSDYCLRDTEIIRKAFQWWYKFACENDLGVFGPTLPSQSFNAFRHRFMDRNIYIHDQLKVTELERQAYFGGRTECFWIGKIPERVVYKLDINSLYPYVMSRESFPVRLTAFKPKPSEYLLNRVVKDKCVIADCRVRIEEPVIPVLYQNRTVFPIGEFQAQVCTRSLQYLLKTGGMLQCDWIAVYDKDSIFKDYVNYFSKVKERAQNQGKRAERKIAKLFLNSLYGKFGQRRVKTAYEFNVDPEIIKNEVVHVIEENKNYHVMAYLGKERWFETTNENSFNAFPAIAAHVTDYARWYLWESIQTTGKENVYYCDTDSLFVNEAGLQNLQEWIHESRMGYWKVEGKADHVELRGPKDYSFQDKVKRKGIRQNAEKIGPNRFKQDQFLGFGSTLMGELGPFSVVKKVEKQLNPEYLKGQVLPEGRVVPYRFCFPEQRDKASP